MRRGQKLADPRLARLAELTAMIRQAETARIARIAAEATHLRRQIADLDRPIGSETDPETDPEMALALQAQIEARHRIWSDRKRAALNMSLAQTLARLEASRASAARAVGRDDVIQKLRSRLFRRL